MRQCGRRLGSRVAQHVARYRSSVEPSVVQGQCFQFVVPAGWRVLEQGQFAVVQADADNQAVSIMTGNCGFLPGYPPLQYAFEKLSGNGPVQLDRPRPGQPVANFDAAVDVDYRYAVNGVPCVGIATVSYRQGYGQLDLVLTAGAAQEQYWPSFAAWLPALPKQFNVTHGAAWGAQGIAQQNLRNSIQFGQQLELQRAWSEELQRQVTDQRDASDERHREGMGQVLTGESWYADPYGQNPPVRLSNTPAVYWTNRHGRIVSSDDPSFDPRTPMDSDWQRMSGTV
jgi:hypothetical protein